MNANERKSGGEFDAIVVGAGLAGLAAATELTAGRTRTW